MGAFTNSRDEIRELRSLSLEFLFVAQCDHRIDSRRTPRREVAGEKRRERECQGVARGETKEGFLEQFHDKKRNHRSSRDAGGQDDDHLAQHQLQDRAPSRAARDGAGPGKATPAESSGRRLKSAVCARQQPSRAAARVRGF